MENEKQEDRAKSGVTELWTVLTKGDDKAGSIGLEFDVKRPKPYTKRQEPDYYRIKKAAYSSEEVERIAKQLSQYCYEITVNEIEENDDWGIEEIVSSYTETEDIDIGDVIVRDGELFGCFVDGHNFGYDTPGSGNYAVSFKEGASLWLQGRSCWRDNGAGFVSHIRSDSSDYIFTLRRREDN